MSEFVLVHGRLHGGWCFELLERELSGIGHRTLAVDLPVDEPGKSVEDHADAVGTARAGQVAEAAWVVGRGSFTRRFDRNPYDGEIQRH